VCLGRRSLTWCSPGPTGNCGVLVPRGPYDPSMSARELLVLGTASQAPTRDRNHNGYLLRWDDEAILLDPGEGAQRQLTLAGVASSTITRICVTHFHGDHCLGLPGIIQRLSLDRVAHTVDIYFPASGQRYLDRLRGACIFHESAELGVHPVDRPGTVAGGVPFRLVAGRLDHRADTFGWRLEEPDGRRMLPDRLEALGVWGPDIGRLQREGAISVNGRRVTVEEVSTPRPGQRFAFVMDTRLCDAALELADGVDLLVCESTYLRGEEALAEEYGHLTAAQAARIAADAGARQLVLTHFSQRHPDSERYAAEARTIFPNVVAARDLLCITLPRRR
jgi:ribonuclease Z